MCSSVFIVGLPIKMSTYICTYDEILQHVYKFVDFAVECPENEKLEDMWLHLVSIIKYAHFSGQPLEIFKLMVTYKKEQKQERYE